MNLRLSEISHRLEGLILGPVSDIRRAWRQFEPRTRQLLKWSGGVLALLIVVAAFIDGGLGTLIAFVAMIIAALSFSQAKRAADANIVRGFLEEYASEAMLENLSLMGKWRNDWSEAQREEWRTCDDTTWENHWSEIEENYGSEDSSKASVARRGVNLYFKKAWRLYDSGYIDRTLMQIITSQSGYSLLFDVAWPLGRLHQFRFIGTPSADQFQWYEDLRREFGDGKKNY